MTIDGWATQAQTARLMGVHDRTISRYLKAGHIPPHATKVVAGRTFISLAWIHEAAAPAAEEEQPEPISIVKHRRRRTHVHNPLGIKAIK
jgi:hypothetical protein